MRNSSMDRREYQEKEPHKCLWSKGNGWEKVISANNTGAIELLHARKK